MTLPRRYRHLTWLRCRGNLVRQLIILFAYKCIVNGWQWLDAPEAPLFVSAPRGRSERRIALHSQSVSEAEGGANTDSESQAEQGKDKTYAASKYNVPIITTILLVAFGLLLRQDVVTIIALYEFSSTMEANWVTESLMVMSRLPTDLIEEYGEFAITQPVLTKAWTSGVAYVIGDIMAQIFEGRRRLEWIDLWRCARNGVAGFVLHGPALHYWIQFLEGPFTTFIGAGGQSEQWWAICAKILLDQTLFAGVLNLAYALLLGILTAKPLDEVWRRAQETLAPSMYSSWRFWPLVHLVTYSPYLPIQFKVLWNDAMEIVWVAILSVIANDEKTAEPTKQKAVIVEDFGVEPAAEVALAAAREQQVVVEHYEKGPSDTGSDETSSVAGQGGRVIPATASQ